MEIKSAFYPEVERRYVYLTSLQNEPAEEPRQLYSQAKGAIDALNQSFVGGAAWNTAYANLNALVQRERQAEEAFLSSNLQGVTMEQVRGFGFKQMVDSFNKILSYESTYQTNLNRVAAMDQGTLKNGQVDRLYALLNFSLPQKLAKYLTALLNGQVENLDRLTRGDFDDEIKEQTTIIVKEEIEKLYGENGTVAAEYEEFSRLMQQLLSGGDFINQLLINYGVSPEQLRQSVTETRTAIRSGGKGKLKSDSQITGKNIMLQKQGGNVFETFINQILNAVSESFQGQTIATGKLNNMKADHIITIGLGNMEERLKQLVEGEKGQGEKSIRLKNIKALEKFFDDLHDVKGSIIFVSDKNYRLNAQSFAENKGFGAENPSIENLNKVLGRAMTRNVGDLEDLIFVLANTGNERINDQTENIERYLATMIGSFVFDDVAITDQLDDQASSVNRIHVFNLGNIYIPLSVFLQAAYQAFQQASKAFTDFVNVEIQPGQIEYTEQTDGLQQSDWSNLYQQAVSKGHVAFHFFGSFVQFISQYIHE